MEHSVPKRPAGYKDFGDSMNPGVPWVLLFDYTI